jgi:hypothetical protein
MLKQQKTGQMLCGLACLLAFSTWLAMKIRPRKNEFFDKWAVN